jgi:hypothetical protein
MFRFMPDIMLVIAVPTTASRAAATRTVVREAPDGRRIPSFRTIR